MEAHHKGVMSNDFPTLGVAGGAAPGRRLSSVPAVPGLKKRKSNFDGKLHFSANINGIES